jgi:hypothetical protein
VTIAVLEFDFEADSRTYTCRVEKRNELADAWWWFGVSGDKQRYAPFRAGADDTRFAIQSRITLYYRELLVRRATPAVPWHRRGKPMSLAAGSAASPPPTEGETPPGSGPTPS